MGRPITITSAANPRVKAAAGLLNQRERRKTGLFLAEGKRTVQRALGAGFAAREFFVLGNKPADAAGFGLPGDVPTYLVSESVMKKLAYQENPEGVVGVFELRERGLRELRVGAEALFLVAVGLAKPGNLGAIARTAEAAGVGVSGGALLVADGVVDAYNPNAIHASTGAVFTLPIVAGDSAEILAFLREKNVRVLVTTPGEGTEHFRADLTGRVAIVIGPEDTGLGEDWLAAGIAVRIPMRGETVDSLNASNAAAILLFEAMRQRMG